MFNNDDYDYEFPGMNQEKALSDFNINIEDYVEEIGDIDDIIYLHSTHMILLNCEIGPYFRNKNWKKVIEKMNLWYANLMMLIKKPNILTAEEKKPLKKMEDYMNNNQGKLTGAYSYRYAVYRKRVQEYKDLVLKNKMTILAYKIEIDDRVQQYRDLLNQRIEKAEKDYSVKRGADKKQWGQTFYTCECGKEVQKVNKSHHIKSNHHIEWAKENKTDENIVICSTALTWHQKKYKCACGKEVANANKSNHEKTKYHQLYQKESVAPDDSEEEIYIIPVKKKQTTTREIMPSGNIVLTIQEIGEKCVADGSNKKFCPDDEALEDFRYF
jgi:hypothetical protein